MTLAVARAPFSRHDNHGDVEAFWQELEDVFAVADVGECVPVVVFADANSDAGPWRSPRVLHSVPAGR
eukprot:4461665-Lingulodinium_polyedra.AAC.1